MIAKKFQRSNARQSKHVNVQNLIEYINAPTTKNAEEKLLLSGGRGFVFDDLETQEEEMLALVHCNVRSPNSRYICDDEDNTISKLGATSLWR